MRRILIATVIALAAPFAVALAAETTATTKANVQPTPVTFPIAELGNCASKDACHTYCEDDTHRDACYTFAKTHRLMTDDEIGKARVFIMEKVEKMKMKVASSTDMHPKEKEGPPNLQGLIARYCADDVHYADCFAFAKNHGLITGSSTMPVKPVKVATTTRPLPPRPGTTTKPTIGAAMFGGLWHWLHK